MHFSQKNVDVFLSHIGHIEFDLDDEQVADIEKVLYNISLSRGVSPAQLLVVWVRFYIFDLLSITIINLQFILSEFT